MLILFLEVIDYYNFTTIIANAIFKIKLFFIILIILYNNLKI